MLYLRLTYYQAQNYITLKPSSDSIFRRFCVIFDLAPVTHGTTRTINSLLIFMEISSHYGSHRAALIACVCDWTEVSLYSCFHRLAESCSAF